MVWSVQCQVYQGFKWIDWVGKDFGKIFPTPAFITIDRFSKNREEEEEEENEQH